MSLKFEQLTELYEQTIKSISKSEDSWKDFLKTACKNYRLSFSEMVLLYAQRPDATAVLQIEDWNKRYGLWVKTGTKGIAVFDSDYNGASRIKYYFDIKDTRRTNKYRPVPIWNLKEEYVNEVMEMLSETFEIPSEKNTLPEMLIQATQELVEDNYLDYFVDLPNSLQGSLLEELDEYNLEIVYKNVLKESIAYTILTRCGFEPQTYIDDDKMRMITQFNTPQAVNAIGVSTKDMSQIILNEIRTTVLNCAKNQNRTFELNDLQLYNENTKEQALERSQDSNENRIHPAGRIYDTKSNIETGKRTAWEIRIDEKTLSEGISSDSIHEFIDNTNVEPALDGNRESSQRQKRDSYETDDGKRTGERGIEGSKSIGMDSSNEQYRGDDSSDNQGRVDLQLNQGKAGTLFQIPAFLHMSNLKNL